MLNSALSLKDYKEVMTDDSQLLLFDSDNPFLSTQTISLSKDTSKFTAGETIKDVSPEEVDTLRAFFDNQIQYSLKRADKFSNNPNVLNNTGVVYLNSRNYEEAKKYFDKAIEIVPRFYPAHANLAKLFFLQHEYDSALNVYNKLKAYFPNDTRVLNNIAHTLLIKGEIDNSLTVLLNIIKKEKKNASIYNNIGVIYILKKEVNKSINHLRKALDIDNNFANAYNNLGLCYLMQKNHKRAITNYLAAISINKNFVVAIKNLARLYQDLGDHKKAIEVINNCLKNNKPDSEMFDIISDSSYLNGNFKEAIKYLSKAISLPPASNNIAEQSRMHNNIAVAYNYLRNPQEACNHYLEAISLYKHPIVFNSLLILLLEMNKLSEAKEILTQALELFPDDCNLLVSEGKYYYAIEEYNKAAISLRKAIEIRPEVITPYALWNHIVTEFDKDLTEAINIIRTGLKYHPNDLALINNLAYTLLLTDDKNNIDEARQLLKEVEGVKNVFLIATKGLLSLKEGNIPECEKLYDRATAIADNLGLRNQLKQKKLLELGKYFLQINEKKKAYNFLNKANKIKTVNKIQLNQVREILSEISR